LTGTSFETHVEPKIVISAKSFKQHIQPIWILKGHASAAQWRGGRPHDFTADLVKNHLTSFDAFMPDTTGV
jgi:hypothetical protein